MLIFARTGGTNPAGPMARTRGQLPPKGHFRGNVGTSPGKARRAGPSMGVGMVRAVGAKIMLVDSAHMWDKLCADGDAIGRGVPPTGHPAQLFDIVNRAQAKG